MRRLATLVPLLVALMACGGGGSTSAFCEAAAEVAEDDDLEGEDVFEALDDLADADAPEDLEEAFETVADVEDAVVAGDAEGLDVDQDDVDDAVDDIEDGVADECGDDVELSLDIELPEPSEGDAEGDDEDASDTTSTTEPPADTGDDVAGEGSFEGTVVGGGETFTSFGSAQCLATPAASGNNQVSDIDVVLQEDGPEGFLLEIFADASVGTELQGQGFVDDNLGENIGLGPVNIAFNEVLELGEVRSFSYTGTIELDAGGALEVTGSGDCLIEAS